MLQAFHLSRSFGALTVLRDVTFALAPGDHAGLVGPNGGGKTTLLRCLAGLDTPDAGWVVAPRGARIGYLAQEPLAPDDTVGHVLDAIADPAAALEAAAAGLAAGGADPAALAAYDDALSRLEAPATDDAAEAGAVLAATGVLQLPREARVGDLSGGERTRLALATLAAGAYDVLLLDEPTNHLDADATAWLARYLRAFPGAVLVVSHDRAFLDRVATSILYLAAETRTVREYTGNYSAFAVERRREADAADRAWREQEAYADRTRRDIQRLKSQARSIETSTTPRQPGLRVYARKKAALAKSREKKLERYMTSEERVEKPRQGWAMDVDFGEAGALGREAVRLTRLGFAYAPGRWLFRGVDLSIRHHERVAVVGPNGGGKTTLLRLIDGSLAPVEGTAWVSPGVRAGYLAQGQETLDPAATVIDAVRRAAPMDEGAARDFLHRFLFAGDSVFAAVATCSPGERARLALALLVLGGCNLLLVDEPLNHLDITSREQFEAALASFDGTVVAVSHDEAFLDAFASRVIEVRAGEVTDFPGTFGEWRARGAADAATAPSARGS
jgi:ATP-binding cassette subfamily F protein 3